MKQEQSVMRSEIETVLNSQEIQMNNSADNIKISLEGKFHMFLGRPGSGKTHLVLYILNHQSEYLLEDIIWLSPTYQSNRTNVRGYKYIDRNFISIDYMRIKNKLLVFDDVGLDLLYSKTMINAILVRRHHQTGWMFLTQGVNMLRPVIRSNISYAYVFRFTTKNELKKIYENFGQTIFDNFNQFLKAFRHVKGHGFMLTDTEHYAICVLH